MNREQFYADLVADVTALIGGCDWFVLVFNNEKLIYNLKSHFKLCQYLCVTLQSTARAVWRRGNQLDGLLLSLGCQVHFSL